MNRMQGRGRPRKWDRCQSARRDIDLRDGPRRSLPRPLAPLHLPSSARLPTVRARRSRPLRAHTPTSTRLIRPARAPVRTSSPLLPFALPPRQDRWRHTLRARSHSPTCPSRPTASSPPPSSWPRPTLSTCSVCPAFPAPCEPHARTSDPAHRPPRRRRLPLRAERPARQHRGRAPPARRRPRRIGDARAARRARVRAPRRRARARRDSVPRPPPPVSASRHRLTQTSGECPPAPLCTRPRAQSGLWFTCEALRNMQQDRDAELHTCFKRSYDANLKQHHSFVVRSVVSVAIRAVPHRHDFYARITQGGSHAKFDSELTKWLAGLEALVVRLKAFLEQGGYGRV